MTVGRTDFTKSFEFNLRLDFSPIELREPEFGMRDATPLFTLSSSHPPLTVLPYQCSLQRR